MAKPFGGYGAIYALFVLEKIVFDESGVHGEIIRRGAYESPEEAKRRMRDYTCDEDGEYTRECFIWEYGLDEDIPSCITFADSHPLERIQGD